MSVQTNSKCYEKTSNILTQQEQHTKNGDGEENKKKANKSFKLFSS